MNMRANTEAALSLSSIALTPAFKQVDTRYDSADRSIWCWINPAPRPCLNPLLLSELKTLQQILTSTYTDTSANPANFEYLILASKTPGIYSLGGDLELFSRLIESRDETALRKYATDCVHLLHLNINNLNLPITAISLVQGDALGGGFEMALSCDIVIAERGVQMGFPEILFNLFPGMGAYNFLARRIGGSLAERIILSGKTYLAEELYDMGVVDVLAEPGEGNQTARIYIESHNRSHKTIRSMKRVRQITHPITEDVLTAIIEVWVESAMELSAKDLKKMQRLLYMQHTLSDSSTSKPSNVSRIARQGEWRKNSSDVFPLVTHLGEQVTHNRRHNVRRHPASS